MFGNANRLDFDEETNTYLVGMTIQHVGRGRGHIARTYQLGGTAYFDAIFDDGKSASQFRVDLLGGWHGYFVDASNEIAHRRLEWPNIRKAAHEADRQTKMRSAITERQISCLIHFTRVENLANILRKGIIPRNDLPSSEFIANDTLRADGFPRASCLSVSFPNYKMLYTHKQGTSSNWAVLEISPEVLVDVRCSFYRTNAAASESRFQSEFSPETLLGAGALHQLFSEPFVGLRDHLRLPPDYPTDPQAEILAFGKISPSRITGVALLRPEAAIEKLIQACSPELQITCPSAYFYRRHDHAHWIRRRWGDVCMPRVQEHNERLVEC